MTWFTDRRQACSNRTRGEGGFTLFELLIVLGILALIATLVAPRLIGYLGRSKTDVAQAQMSSISTALELYYLDMGRYPLAEEGLAALVAAPEDTDGWRGPYFGNESGLMDPWDRPYDYALGEDNDRYVLTSLGKDGEIGGDGEDTDLSRN
jgi:general secretion pathway protein G